MVRIDPTTCDYCRTCVGACPENCIEMGTHYIAIDYSICTECGICVHVCPLEAVSEEEE